LIYLIIHPITNEKFEFVDDFQSAKNKKEEIKQSVIISEAYRFTVAKEIITGENSTWTNANLEIDPEDCRYQVFNIFNGQHELFLSLTEAKNRVNTLLNEYIDSLELNDDPQEKPKFKLNPNISSNLPVTEL
jgi:hypothetical protein